MLIRDYLFNNLKYNKIKLFIYIISILILNSCFPLTSNSLKKIQIRDTEIDVIKNLGRPYTIKAFYNKKYLVYYVHDDFFSIFLNDNKFPYIGFYPFLRTGQEYWIIMENNLVVSYGTAKNYKNSIPRALSSSGTTIDLEID